MLALAVLSLLAWQAAGQAAFFVAQTPMTTPFPMAYTTSALSPPTARPGPIFCTPFTLHVC